VNRAGKATIKAENRKYTDYYLEVAVEVTGRPSATPATSAFDVVEDTTPEEPRQRRTRTMQQKERAARRRDANKVAGNWSEKLIDKLLCATDTCSNKHGYCWISWDGTHYNINSTQRSTWADAIPGDRYGASIDWPPQSLYEYLIRKQGSVTKESRKSIQQEQKNETKDRMERLQDLALQQAELNIIISMASASRQQQQPIQQQYSASYPVYQTQLQSQLHPQLVPALRYASYLPDRFSGKDRGRSIIPSSLRGSSPIGEPIAERQIIQDFWNWKLNAANNAEERQLLLTAKAIIARQM
jgi:hypothetical protein